MTEQRTIYMDNQATTPLDPRVLDAMLPWMVTEHGNAHSRSHVLGDRAADATESARAAVAALAGARPEQVVFTSGATESANIAIEGFCRRMQELCRKARVAVLATEHAAVLEPCNEMARRGLAQLSMVPVDTAGRLDLAHLESICRKGIDLICVMGANNEIGNIYPVESIGAIASAHGAAFFCDGSQSLGKVAFSFEACQVDFLAVSAHKMYGPKGVGALVVRNSKSLTPTKFGGSQELGLRPGTLNVPGIVGLGGACRLRMSEMDGDEKRIRGMRDRLQALLSARIPRLQVNGDPAARLAGNLHLSIAGVPNVAILALVRDRLAISSGAACSSGTDAPSHVLRAIRLGEEWIGGSLRFGLGKFNIEDDVVESAEILCDAVGRVT